MYLDIEYVKLYNKRTMNGEWSSVSLRNNIEPISSVIRWLKCNCEGEHMVGLSQVIFENERDAMMYRLHIN